MPLGSIPIGVMITVIKPTVFRVFCLPESDGVFGYGKYQIGPAVFAQLDIAGPGHIRPDRRIGCIYLCEIARAEIALTCRAQSPHFPAIGLIDLSILYIPVINAVVIMTGMFFGSGKMDSIFTVGGIP